MGFKDFTVDVDVSTLTVGDVVKIDGKNYKVRKRLATTVSVSRHYWFDTMVDWIEKRIKS